MLNNFFLYEKNTVLQSGWNGLIIIMSKEGLTHVGESLLLIALLIIVPAASAKVKQQSFMMLIVEAWKYQPTEQTIIERIVVL